MVDFIPNQAFKNTVEILIWLQNSQVMHARLLRVKCCCIIILAIPISISKLPNFISRRQIYRLHGTHL